MKIHIISDLHLEFSPHWDYKPPKADLTLVAGDISHGANSIRSLEAFGYTNPVCLVAGNHEFYGGTYQNTLQNLEKYDSKNIHFLEFESRVFGDAVVLGVTLWTDFELYGNSRATMDYAEENMGDYREIRIDPSNSLLSATITQHMHDNAVEWLDTEMLSYPSMKKVVLTHHAPSEKSVSKRYEKHPLNAAFVSNLEWLMRKHSPALWVHGHVHSSHDYMVGKTRVVANPKGYPTDRFQMGLRNENADFDSQLVVEI